MTWGFSFFVCAVYSRPVKKNELDMPTPVVVLMVKLDSTHYFLCKRVLPGSVAPALFA